jgi:hypothetical protein
VSHLGVLVHCPSCLGAAPTVLAVEFQCGDGVVTKWALKLGKTAHIFDGVISHNFNCRRAALARLRTKVFSDRQPLFRFRNLGGHGSQLRNDKDMTDMKKSVPAFIISLDGTVEERRHSR